MYRVEEQRYIIVIKVKEHVSVEISILESYKIANVARFNVYIKCDIGH